MTLIQNKNLQVVFLVPLKFNGTNSLAYLIVKEKAIYGNTAVHMDLLNFLISPKLNIRLDIFLQKVHLYVHFRRHAVIHNYLKKIDFFYSSNWFINGQIKKMWVLSLIIPFTLSAHLWAGFIFIGCNISNKDNKYDSLFWENNCKFMEKKIANK